MKFLRLATLVLGAAVACGPAPDTQSPELVVQEDLVDTFPLADVTVETVGAPHNIPLGDGWSPHEGRIDEEQPRWSLGAASEAHFVVLRPRPLELVLAVRPFIFPGSPVQTLTVQLGGEPMATLELTPKLDTYRVPLPTDKLEAGENQLRFLHGYHRSPKDVLGTADARSLAVAWSKLAVVDPAANPEPATLNTSTDSKNPRAENHRLALPAGSQVDYYVEVGQRAELVVQEWNPRGSMLEIFWQTEGSTEVLVAKVESPRDAATLALPIDSSPLDGTLGRLRFRSLGSGSFVIARPVLRSTPRPATPRPATPRPATPRPATPRPGPTTLTPTLSLGRERGPDASKPHILLYLIDTLRADHLGCYGYPRPTSPRLDAFAAEAVLFERVVAQSSWTRSSVASLLTGLGPLEHGALKRNHPLNDEHLGLAEILRDAGWNTAAFVTNPNVTPVFGFEQGFDHFDDLGEDTTSDQVTRATTRWLEEQLEERLGEPQPLFLYVHTMDPHDPYKPPADLIERFADPSPFNDLREAQRVLNDLQAGRRDLEDQLLDGLRDLYDAEIAANDRAFGELVDALKKQQLYDGMWIIVVSDHGEEFHDHGHFRHGKALFEESIGVPLIVKPPTGTGATGRRVVEPVQHIDLLPTLLAELGLQGKGELKGRHLLKPLEPAPLFSYLHLDGPPRASITHEGFRLLVRRDGERLISPRLFHLPSDPGELRDLAPDRPIRTGYLTRVLREHLRAPRSEPEETELDPELRQRLEALGYVE